MAHGQAKRTHARAPTPVLATYATLPQVTKDHGLQRRFAAKCNSQIIKALKGIKSNSYIKTALPQTLFLSPML
jgi:hypothetical protein